MTGNIYEFCSENCKNKFTAEPERYIADSEENLDPTSKEHSKHNAERKEKKTTGATYKISSTDLKKLQYLL